MTKIQFINRQPVYEKVIIPVEDHVTCSCQSRVSAHSPRLQTTPLPPPRPKVTLPKTQSKEELHRNDELKHNQRLHLEDKESQELQWQSKNTVTHTQGYQQSPYQHTISHTPVYVSRGDVPTKQTTLGDPHMMSDATQTEEVDRMKSENSGDGMAKKTQQHYDKHLQEDQQPRPQQPQDKTTPQQPKYNLSHNPVQSGHSIPQSSQLDTFSHTYSHVEVIGQSSGLSEVLNHHSDQSEVRKHHHHHQSEASNQNMQEGEQQQETQHHLRHQHHQHHQLHQHTTQAVSQQQTSTQKTGQCLDCLLSHCVCVCTHCIVMSNLCFLLFFSFL